MNNMDISKNTVSELSKEYYDSADKLEKRLHELIEKLNSRPDPAELPMLEKRINVLNSEIWELRDTAGKLMKAGSEPPLTPSLAAREKLARKKAV